MEKIALFLLCALGVSATYAQEEGNPFARYGYKTRVSTTIMGRTVLHDRQKVVAVGSVLFDAKTKTIIGDFEAPDSSTLWIDPQIVNMFISDIGRFSTPDPLAEKYYHMSPYAYCLNNPIRFVDPDGMDVWQIDIEGNIINRIEDTTQDAFHFGSVDADGNFQIRQVKDDDGNMVDVAISFKHGTVTNQFNRTISAQDKDGKTVERNLTIFEIKGDDNATQLFEMMADPFQSTNVEWTHAKIGTENSGQNMIGTAHQSSSTAVGGYLLSTSYTLKEVNHNHPRGNMNTSPGDEKAAEKYHERNSNTILNIYTYPGKYHRYNQNGLIP